MLIYILQLKHLCIKYDGVQSYIALRFYCLRIASDGLFDVYRWQHPAWFFFKRYIFPVHAVKAYWGSRHIAPLIFNLVTGWRWVVNFTPWPLCPGTHSLRASDPVWTFGEDKNFFPLRDSTPARPAHSLFSIPAAFPRVLIVDVGGEKQAWYLSG